MSDPLGRGWTSDRHREINQKEAMDRLQSSLREAQEAAEEYHAAWQECTFFSQMLTDAVDGLLKGRDRLREALKQYGAHDYECDRIRLNGEEDPSRPCTCGLDQALKAGEG